MRPVLREVRRGWPSGICWTRPGGPLQSGGRGVPTRAHTRHDPGATVGRDPGRSRAAFWGSRAKQLGLSVPIMSHGAGRGAETMPEAQRGQAGPGSAAAAPARWAQHVQVRGAAERAPSDGRSQHPTERLGPRLRLPVPGSPHRRRHAAPLGQATLPGQGSRAHSGPGPSSGHTLFAASPGQRGSAPTQQRQP